MYFYEIMEKLIKDRNLKIADISKLCGLPDSTVRSIFLRKQKSIALEVAFKISKGLNVSLEFLNGDIEEVNAEIKKAPANEGLTQEQQEVLLMYDKLDNYDKNVILGIFDSLLNNVKYQKNKGAESHCGVG